MKFVFSRKRVHVRLKTRKGGLTFFFEKVVMSLEVNLFWVSVTGR